MTRRRLAHSIALSLALLSLVAVGCGGKKDKDKTASAKSKNQQMSKTQSVSHDRDPFEQMEDPPINANTRVAAGQLAEAQGDLHRAVGQYQEALKLDPNNREALFGLGQVYTIQKHFEDAIAAWQKYLKVTKNSAHGYMDLALTYEAAGRWSDADAAFKQAIAKDPDDASCRINYGLMLARQNQIEDAKAQLSAVLSPAEVSYNLGSICEQMGRRDEAKAYYARALELDPKLQDARVRLAILNDPKAKPAAPVIVPAPGAAGATQPSADTAPRQ